MTNQYDRSAEDIGNIVELEHVNLRVADQGLATLFYSLRPDGAPDPFSLHGGCPPENDGVKWAVNKWVWSKNY